MPKGRKPKVHEIRNLISGIVREDIRYCFMACYLLAARISEVVGRASPGDTSVARGPRGIDATKATYNAGKREEPAVVFTIQTAKRGGRERKVALPIHYEPWATELYEYFQLKGDKRVFPFTRQRAWDYSRRVFAGLRYQIDRYWIVDAEMNLRKKIPEHKNPFRLHALRHLRASELVEFYGFDGFNLATYGGWTYQTMTQVTPTMSRYLSLGWQSYFPKLLKRRQ